MRTALSLVVIVAASVAGAGDAVHGDVSVKHGQRLVRVWGSHAERGRALGVLLGEEAVSLFRVYVPTFIGWGDYALLRLVYGVSFVVPPEFETEAQALVAGAREAGVDLFISELGRELDELDLAIMSSIPDLDAVGVKTGVACSSVSVWDTGLEPEPGFDGRLVHARNLEWSDTASHDLAASTIVVMAMPSEPDEQPWVAVTFPGMWGALSAMNAAGVGVTLNMGNHKVSPSFPCDPVLMTIRRSIEKADANGDGRCDLADVSDGAATASHGSSYILHTFMPPDEAGSTEPDVVVETNAEAFAVRLDVDDPVTAPDVLLATNHHRTAYAPVPCDRYATLQDAVVAERPVDTLGVYEIARRVSQGVWTLQSMILRPDPRDLFVTHIAKDGGQTPLVHLTWAEMLDPPLPVPIISGPCAIAPGESVTLDAGAGYEAYSWSTGATTRTIEVAPLATRTYAVTVVDASGWQGGSGFTVRVLDGTAVHLDCFETGDLAAWSAVVGSAPVAGRWP